MEDVIGAAEITEVKLGLDHYATPLFWLGSLGIHLVCNISRATRDVRDNSDTPDQNSGFAKV